MELLLSWAKLFREFLVNDLVPFFTTVPDFIPVPYYYFPLYGDPELRYFQLPWLFGDFSFGEFILVYGLFGIIAVKLVKLLWDALPFA